MDEVSEIVRSCINYVVDHKDVKPIHEGQEIIDGLYVIVTEEMGSGKPLIGKPGYDDFMIAKHTEVYSRLVDAYKD